MLYLTRIKIVIILIIRKEPEPQLVISAPASGGNLISAPRLWLRNTGTQFLSSYLLFFRNFDLF